MAVMVESISNVTIQNTPVILARVANALPIIQMGLFIGYQNSDYSQFTRSACYVSGQVAAVVADSMLFYLLYYLTEVYNVSHSKRITRLAKVVLAISIMLEVVYKVTLNLIIRSLHVSISFHRSTEGPT